MTSDWRRIADDLYSTLSSEHAATASCEVRTPNCCVVGRTLARYEAAVDFDKEPVGQADEYAEHPLGGSWDGEGTVS